MVDARPPQILDHAAGGRGRARQVRLAALPAGAHSARLPARSMNDAMRTDRRPVRVVDLTPEHEPLYFVCLEDWPGADLAEAGDHKARWFRKMSGLGLKVKLALDADGRVGGMIQYLPIEHSPAVGRGLEFILCVWVHGHAQGRGDFQGQGMGTALLEAAEADARERGVAGMAA